ncbi:13822_t:CDS:2 [Acaulospora morrowiae]|uniref:13822_t:CDS:1 n=1 Tax=Acaulospora morrowiae TaxID=94023 RepID=A0A9N8YP21_9GLOM|nr:13822_t:CDS:2 [Acaulospora morrowiae]
MEVLEEQLIKEKNVVMPTKVLILLMSPPMAGKTALTQLLEHSLLQSDEVKKGSKQRFKELMNVTWDEFIDKCDKTTFLIIDEEQKIYKSENEAEPRHAFASYGHYGAYAARGDYAIMDISPFSQKSNTYFNYFCEKNPQMLKEDDPLLSCYVSEITAHHPGLVAFTMSKIHEIRQTYF